MVIRSPIARQSYKNFEPCFFIGNGVNHLTISLAYSSFKYHASSLPEFREYGLALSRGEPSRWARSEATANRRGSVVLPDLTRDDIDFSAPVWSTDET